MKMGLVHDLAESIVGDITPVDDVSVDDKHQMELVPCFLIDPYLGSALHDRG